MVKEEEEPWKILKRLANENVGNGSGFYLVGDWSWKQLADVLIKEKRWST